MARQMPSLWCGVVTVGKLAVDDDAARLFIFAEAVDDDSRYRVDDNPCDRVDDDAISRERVDDDAIFFTRNRFGRAFIFAEAVDDNACVCH